MSKNKKQKQDIKIANLKELFKVCEKNIRGLLKSAEVLHQSIPQKSIPLIILALEETYKLNKLSKYITSKKNMNKDEWDKLLQYGSHGKKIRGFFQDALDEYKKMKPSVYSQVAKQLNTISELNYKESYDDVITDEDYILNSLNKLQIIKLDSLYVGWDFQKRRITDITKTYNVKELKILSVYLFDLVKFLFMDVLLNYKYLVHYQITIDINHNIMFQDPLWKECEEYFKRIKESNYSRIINIGKVMLETYPEKLPEKYTPKKHKKKLRKN